MSDLNDLEVFWVGASDYESFDTWGRRSGKAVLCKVWGTLFQVAVTFNILVEMFWPIVLSA